MRNFMRVFERVESIPLAILIEPFVRQIQLSESISFSFNVFDMEFFMYVSKNPRLQLKTAIQLLDLLFKLYLKNTIFAPLASISMLNIVAKFIDNEALLEFVLKFVKVALAMFYASEKLKRPKKRSGPLYNNRG